MFRQQFTKLDAFGVQDCGLTGDSCGQPLFSHKPSYWFKSKSSLESFFSHASVALRCVISAPTLRSPTLQSLWQRCCNAAMQSTYVAIMNDCYPRSQLECELLTLSCLLFQPFIRTVVRTLFILFLHNCSCVVYVSAFVRSTFVRVSCLC